MTKPPRRAKPPPAGERQVRTRVMREFGADLPETARLLFDWAAGGGSSGRQRPMLSLTTAVLPPSVNHMYVAVGNRRVLSVEAQDFRQLVLLGIGSQRFDWKPAGPVMAMVFLLSPLWLTKRHTIRDADADNRLKSFFDAVQVATDVPDNTNWQFHCWKIPSSRTATVAYLFDLGDVVEVYG